MSLGIHIAADHKSPPAPGEPAVSFDDDENGGYYWFLHPLFAKLAETTGQYIDLYGNAEFRGESLDALGEALHEACRLIREQPARWMVHVGTQTAPTHREVFKEVERSKFEALLEQFSTIVARSKATGLPVICLGD